MAQRKGQTGNPNGRPKGVGNKLTSEIKEIIKGTLDDNAANVKLWLERISFEDPHKALDMYVKLAEFIIPKLARVDGTVSGDVSINVHSAIPGAPFTTK